MIGNVSKAGLVFIVCMLFAGATSAQNRKSTTDVEALVKGYISAWRETDPVKREKLLADVWAPNGVYADGQSQVKGPQQLAEYIGLVGQLAPSDRITEISKVESHHGTFRFAWRSVMPDGTLLDEGMDFGEVDKYGRIRRLVVFQGPLAPVSKAK